VTRTKTDPGAFERALEDEPLQLREWGTERIHQLPPHGIEDWPLGAGTDCWLRLQDDQRYVSRRHAVLRRVDSCWSIIDVGSKNGVWIDGHRVEQSTLTPGLEIGIGRLRLVVESPSEVRRRALLGRFLGWNPERRVAVDRALRALREHAARRAPLWLTGSDDLPSIARRLHVELHGALSPFVMLSVDDLVRVDVVARGARGGTLCLHSRRPMEARRILAVVQGRDLGCSIVVCSPDADQVIAIQIPQLGERADEVERVIDEYAMDALSALAASPSSFTEADRSWLLQHPPATLTEIEQATVRLIAVRAFGGVTRAAPQLGVTHSALSRWLGRRFARRASK
jgi:Inner membrane component of T3SS, cytoplasmic domain